MTPPVPKVLLLGGTADALRIAAELARAGLPAVYSVAGRTETPTLPDLPCRSGGFGGPEGLTAYLHGAGITHVVDATHPFAAQMSRNAVTACAGARVPLIALERAPWTPGPGDRWRGFAGLAEIAAALPQTPTCVFLAIGRQNLDLFAAHPQHHYLLRLVDPPQGSPLAGATVVVSKGPFTAEGDLALMRSHGTALVIAKNAGGSAASAKLEAARTLGIPVWLAERPPIPDRPRAEHVHQVMDWLTAHGARLKV
ncbi:MAG: cobalt-precorrin-6A reductase [Paracoccaceae bacterium]